MVVRRRRHWEHRKTRGSVKMGTIFHLEPSLFVPLLCLLSWSWFPLSLSLFLAFVNPFIAALPPDPFPLSNLIFIKPHRNCCTKHSLSPHDILYLSHAFTRPLLYSCMKPFYGTTTSVSVIHPLIHFHAVDLYLIFLSLFSCCSQLPSPLSLIPLVSPV